MAHEAVASGADDASVVSPVLDAIVLAGGRSSRLGGEPKAALRLGGASLLDIAVRAVSPARRVAVVGDAAPLAAETRLSDRIVVTSEQPEFAGPAAAIEAGARILGVVGSETSDYTIVLACDLPRAEVAVRHLLDALEPTTDDGVIAVDASGRLQYLVAVYSTAALTAATEGRDLTGKSVRSLVSGLRLAPVTMPDGTTADVDTWTDAAGFGIDRPHSPPDTTIRETT